MLSVKIEDVVSPTVGADANPPILSPHGKIPQGFSQELAERLKSSTPLKSLGNANGNSILSEKAAKAATFLNSNINSAPEKESMESKSNRIASSSLMLTDSEVAEESGGVIVLTLSSRLRALHLSKWSLSDVVDVLKVNGCAAYAQIFIKKVGVCAFELVLM